MSVPPISFEICVCVQIPETGGDRHRTPICLHKNKRRLLSQFPAKTTASCCDVSSKKSPVRSKASKAFCFCLGYPTGRVLLGLLQRPLLFCYFKNNLFCLLLCRYTVCYFPVTRHFYEEISSYGSAEPAASSASHFPHRSDPQLLSGGTSPVPHCCLFHLPL